MSEQAEFLISAAYVLVVVFFFGGLVVKNIRWRPVGRPPRHARPAGRTTQTEPASSPVVSPTMTDEQRQVLRRTLPDLGTWTLSPLSRESMRRRFRIMWAQHTSGRVV